MRDRSAKRPAMLRVLAYLMVTLWLATTAGQAADVARPVAELDRILGKDARSIALVLGPPAIDVREGPAQRLQFSSASCILDVYLYPPAAGQIPVATYITARVLDGREAERNSCIAALRARR